VTDEHIQKARGLWLDLANVARSREQEDGLIASALSEAYRSGVEAERARCLMIAATVTDVRNNHWLDCGNEIMHAIRLPKA
jgi:hypothetical protein